jgi:CheY-like chemotaxis protein
MSSKKILVVDDDMICRKAVSNFAKKHEITADAAESGAEAIELVKNNQYAIIMIDLFMPGMDGYQTAQQIRGLPNGANTKLVVMSGGKKYFYL